MSIEHVTESGESVTSLAAQYGFFASTIWDFPANAGLRERRSNMDTLRPGDVVMIPNKAKKVEACVTEARHRFVRRGIPAVFRLQLFDEDKPRANQKYQLDIDGKLFPGTTDDEGVLRVNLPPASRVGQVVIGPDRMVVALRFGELDPIEETAGVQKRLNNLGFECGEADGEMNARTAGAIREFQHRFGLETSGELDSATRKKLGEAHDTNSEFPAETRAGARTTD